MMRLIANITLFTHTNGVGVTSNNAGSLALQKQSKGHLSFAVFCDGMLKVSQSTGARAAKKYAETFIQHCLLAMKLENIRAQDMFPRVLQLIGTYPHCKEVL